MPAELRDASVDVVEIARLGSQGDGIATISGQQIFVPFALPGERVRIAGDGERRSLVDVLEASAERTEPICPHFTRCGGCGMQHLAHASYQEWKRGLVAEALRQRGIACDVAPLHAGMPGERRRAVLSAARVSGGGDMHLGFHQAMSHDIVPLRVCPVLEPRLETLLAPLRSLLARLPHWQGEARVVLVAADNGIDVAIETSQAGRLGPERRAELAREAAALPGVLRVSLSSDVLTQKAEPVVGCGRAEVVPPPGVFLQASRSAELAMAGLIAEALPRKARRVADLFCGVGAFSFVLAERAHVLAVDSDAVALAALEAAVRRATKLKPIETRARDLFREPLSRKELEGFDAVVLDPPRAGCRAQAEMLARSAVPVIVAVSCNPATLARDLRILIDAGYALQRVTPIDQFVFSEHVEAVAVLSR
ncbi:MAG: class I SAM-dependent RNA methyltransferase [Hyphomicrobiaceae bacterium]